MQRAEPADVPLLPARTVLSPRHFVLAVACYETVSFCMLQQVATPGAMAMLCIQ